MNLKLPLLSLILVAFNFGSKGQSVYPSREQLLKVFQSSINQKDRNKVEINASGWLTSNENEDFFNADTIKLYSNGSFPRVDYCKFIQWTFYQKDAFVQTAEQYCKEPTSASVPIAKDFYKVKLMEKKDSLFMQLVVQEQLKSEFKVLNLQWFYHDHKKDYRTYSLTLLRQKAVLLETKAAANISFLP